MKPYTVVFTADSRVHILHTEADAPEDAAGQAYVDFVEAWTKTTAPTLDLPTLHAVAVFGGHLESAVTMETPVKISARVEIA